MIATSSSVTGGAPGVRPDSVGKLGSAPGLSVTVPAQAAQSSRPSSAVASGSVLGYEVLGHEEGIVAMVLEISGMPRALRPAVESAMVECVESEPQLVIPGADPLTAQWCTRWFRDALIVTDEDVAAGKTSGEGVGLGCRQVLTGTLREMAALRTRVEGLAKQHAFRAAVVAA